MNTRWELRLEQKSKELSSVINRGVRIGQRDLVNMLNQQATHLMMSGMCGWDEAVRDIIKARVKLDSEHNVVRAAVDRYLRS